MYKKILKYQLSLCYPIIVFLGSANIKIDNDVFSFQVNYETQL